MKIEILYKDYKNIYSTHLKTQDNAKKPCEEYDSS